MLLPACLALALAAAPDLPTPDDIHRLAASDLLDRPDADRPFTRYLSLHAVPEADREEFLRALLFWVNSTTFRRRFVPLDVAAGGLLVRLDLRELEWDAASRARRLAAAAADGATFAFPDAEARRLFLDIWESFVREDVYFKVTAESAPDRRGWIDPERDRDARLLSRSAMLVLRADWWLAKASFGRPDGFKGLYDELMFLPAREADLYKMLGADERYAERHRLAVGGARASGTSIVALHNRELEMIPIQSGKDHFLWRTRDVVNDLGGRSIRRNFAGSLEYDGREIIWSLPNGLHAYYLANGRGERAEEVPATIAQDKQDPYDGRVVSPYKCLRCHGRTGIRGFRDAVGELALSPDVGLAAISKDPARVSELKVKAEDYYFGEARESETAAQQAGYRDAVKRLTGRDAGTSSANYLRFVNAYVWGGVDRGAASREFGVPEAGLTAHLKASGHPELLAIAAGQRASREAFEQAFKAGARVPRFRWER